jgi:putative glycosyltransferase (TIGR04372 family)
MQKSLKIVRNSIFIVTKRILVSIVAIFLVIIIRLIYPLIIVRVGTLNSRRIGHFITESIMLIYRSNFQKKRRQFELISFSKDISNRYWAKMVKSKVKIYGKWLNSVVYWNFKIPGGKRNSYLKTEPGCRDLQLIFTSYDLRISFKEYEQEVAYAWLRKHGWQGEKIICLNVRDSSYLNETYPEVNWDYHDYRNSDIGDYIPAIEWLTGQGYWVIRMGKIANKKVTHRIEKFIDYSFDPDRSDFLDIWLFANCDGCITTATGPDTLCLVYRVPMLVVNVLPFNWIFSYADMIWIPKHLYWNDSKKLSIEEYLQHMYDRTIDYENAGIIIRDLEPQEILDGVIEFVQRISGEYLYLDSDKNLQESCWNDIKADKDFNKFHGKIHPRARVGRDWLRTMNQLN